MKCHRDCAEWPGPAISTASPTVVLKLFQIVQPDKAFFGLKDAQQYAIIHRMCADFNLPVEVVGCPIVREPDGLAMSSRNVYLNGEERRQAAVLRKALKQAERLATDHPDRTVGELAAKMREIIGSAPLAEPEYVEAVLFPSLSEIPGDRSVRQLGGETVLFALAVRFGSTRLIDNTILEL